MLPPLLAALGDPAQLERGAAAAGSMQLVTLRTIPPQPDPIVVHPLGSLTVRETVVPLDITITQFNGATPADGTEFQITGVTLNGTPAAITPLTEDFAIAQFTTMSDADKLSAPSYEPFDAGRRDRRRADRRRARQRAHRDLLRSSYIDDYASVSRFGGIYTMPAAVHDALAGSGARLPRSPAATDRPRSATRTPGMTSPVSVSSATYAVASTTDLTPRTDIIGARRDALRGGLGAAATTSPRTPASRRRSRSSPRRSWRHERQRRAATTSWPGRGGASPAVSPTPTTAARCRPAARSASA